jgi:hypothetical protein
MFGLARKANEATQRAELLAYRRIEEFPQQGYHPKIPQISSYCILCNSEGEVELILLAQQTAPPPLLTPPCTFTSLCSHNRI